MLIAHSLIEELGSRRATTFLAGLEMPDLQLAPHDRQALTRFLERVAEHYGPEHETIVQLRRLNPDRSDGCPE